MYVNYSGQPVLSDLFCLLRSRGRHSSGGVSGKDRFIGATPQLCKIYGLHRIHPATELQGLKWSQMPWIRYNQSLFDLVAPWINLVETLFMAMIAALILRLRARSRSLCDVGSISNFYRMRIPIVELQGVVLGLVAPEIMLLAGVVLPTMGQAVSQESKNGICVACLAGSFRVKSSIRCVSTSDLSAFNNRQHHCPVLEFRGFTTMSEKLPPEKVVALLNPYS